MASFWDDFKDLFKTESQLKEERQKELAAALEAEKSITGQLAELDREYHESLPVEPEPDLDKLFPESLGLEKVDYTPETDEQIEERVSAGIESEKAEERNELESSYAKKEQALGEEADSARKDMDESYRELDALYKELTRATENDAIERGVARGSIMSSALSDLSAEKAASEADTAQRYREAMTAVEKELDNLEKAQETAFSELDLKYAAELEERIAKLKEERDETARKYAEYNNKVAKQEQEYAVQREKDIADFLEEREKERLEREEKQREQEAKYGYTGEKQKNYAERYDIALAFYSSLSPDIAADALDASPNMRYFLGNYYDKLMSALKSSYDGTKRYY